MKLNPHKAISPRQLLKEVEDIAKKQTLIDYIFQGSALNQVVRKLGVIK